MYDFNNKAEDEGDSENFNTLDLTNTQEDTFPNKEDKHKKEITWLNTIKDSIEHSIGHINEAPPYIQDNQHIIYGYRINFFKKRKIFRSLFMCHNETFNIWSHLLMVIFCMYLIYINDDHVNNSINLLHSEQIWTLNKNHSISLHENIPYLYNIRLFYSGIISYSEMNKSIDKEYLLEITNIAKKKINLESVKDHLKLGIPFVNIEEILKNLYTLHKQLEVIKNITTSYLNQNIYLQKDIVKLTEILEEKESYFSYYIDLINTEYSNYFKKYKYIKEGETPESLIGDYFSSRKQIKLHTWPIYVFLYLAIICFLNSAVYHLFCAYGENANAFFSRLDYAGISLLISGSCIPPYYYLYYCSSYYKSIFVGFIFSCSFLVFILTLTPNFNKPLYRKVRGFLFLALGLSAASPLIHLFFFFNSSIGMLNDPILRYWIGGGVFYILGLMVYLSRQPEKSCKGKFDYCGASHQIWHLFTIIGMLTHYIGCLGSYYDRVLQECPNI